MEAGLIVFGARRRLFSAIGWRRISRSLSPQAPESLRKEMKEAEGSENWALFQSWKLEFNKNYESEEETLLRYKIFCRSKEEVDKWNSEDHSWKKGLNQFSDLTSHELPCHHVIQEEGTPPRTNPPFSTD